MLELGNKATQLCKLVEVGVRVPDFVVLWNWRSDSVLEEFFKYKEDRYSVRSSGVISMPGMMDTILDVKYEELEKAFSLVRDSWNNERCIEYRNRHNIGDDKRGCVIIQKMVYGNKNRDSGSGVCIVSKDEKGKLIIQEGRYLEKRTGEAIVCGRENTLPLNNLKATLPLCYIKLESELTKIVNLYPEPQEVEFTYEDFVPFILQTRNAPIRQHREHDLSETTVIEIISKGDGCGFGLIKGQVVFDRNRLDLFPSPIYVCKWFQIEDFSVVDKCIAIVTGMGNSLSHAALIARKENVVGVYGVGGKFGNFGKQLSFDELVLNEGDEIIVDGINGIIGTQYDTSI